MRRRLRDLEQRSAGEHEVLNHLRTLPEVDCLRLTRRLREGHDTDDVLSFARELSNIAASERLLAASQQPTAIDRPNLNVPGTDSDSASDRVVGETLPFARPRLPPITSIWYTSHLYQPSHCAIVLDPYVDIVSLGTPQSIPPALSFHPTHPGQV